MILEFKSVLPFPLKDYLHSSESVWKNNFSLTFPQKVILNASSGKGKSTFINMVYGLRMDFEGLVLLDGKDISNYTLDEWVALRRMDLSVIFQDLQLFGDLTLLENLKLKNQLTNHKTETEISEMIELLGLTGKENQVCKTLSYGQQQRVAIIRALLQPFKLLLMDEPFSHLDEENTAIAFSLINTESDKNKAGYILTSLGSKHGYMFDQELKL